MRSSILDVSASVCIFFPSSAIINSVCTETITTQSMMDGQTWRDIREVTPMSEHAYVCATLHPLKNPAMQT